MSAVINGTANWDTCWRQAAYLCALMYKNPPPSSGFHTQHPEMLAEAENNWEMWDEVNQQSQNGLIGRLFKLKNWNPEDPEAPPRPPCSHKKGKSGRLLRRPHHQYGGATVV